MKNLWIPADRFLAVVDRKGQPYVGKHSHLGRRLLALRSGDQKFIGLHTADRILIKLGLENWWHIRPEDGGLADIYEDGIQYGNPNYRPGINPPAPPRKYATHEARLAARRERYRDAA